MELPRNIVQIGEPDKQHKIFIEDYVLSYMKQSIKRNRETLNAYGRLGPKMVLYGNVREENEITYYFLYAAALLTEASEHEGYLTQDERRETEETRLHFFPDYAFKAFCTLGEDLPDGFYIAEGLKGRPVRGYACFYEKNDSMLSYMLYKKKDEKPEADAGKPKEKQEEILKKAAVERRAVPAQEKKEPAVKTVTSALRAGAMWVLIVLCIIGITAINDTDKLKSWKDAVVRGFEAIGEQKIPDREAVRLPDESVEAGSQQVVADVSSSQIQNMVSENMLVIEAEKQGETQPPSPELPPEPKPEEPLPVQTPEPSPEVTETGKEPEAYVIARGDTLLSISREKYGTIEMVKKICELNQIENPDSIEIGQTILLP